MFSKNLEKYINNNRFSNEFKNLGRIGKGGFAEVLKAKHNIDGQVYALKRIKLKIKNIKSNLDQEISRVVKEARYLAKINHPNIVRYFGSWIELKSKTNAATSELK